MRFAKERLHRFKLRHGTGFGYMGHKSPQLQLPFTLQT